MTTLQSIALTAIRPNPEQPRRTFDQESLEQLAASLTAYGQLQPIAVRPDGGDTYIIIAGERRWRAAQLADWTEIAAVVRQDLNEDEAFELSLMENVMREAMNPVEEIKAFRRLLDMGIAEEEICDRYGWVKGTVNWKLSLLGCRDDVQHLVAHGQLSMVQGIQLGRLSHNGQAKALRLLNNERLTALELTQVINAIYGQENSVEMFAAAEVQVSEEARKAGKVARDFLRLAGAAAGQLQDCDDQSLGEGLTGEVGAQEKVEAIMVALQRLKTILRRRRGQVLAGTLTSQEPLDISSPAGYNPNRDNGSTGGSA